VSGNTDHSPAGRAANLSLRSLFREKSQAQSLRRHRPRLASLRRHERPYWTAGLAVDSSGNLSVANFNSNTVQVYNRSHQLVSTISGPTSGLNKPYGLAVDAFGNLHVANFGNGTITHYHATGNLKDTIKGLNQPIYLTTDELGNTWVVDKNLTRLTASDISNGKVPHD